MTSTGTFTQVSINFSVPEGDSYRQLDIDLRLTRVPCVGEHVAIGDECFEVMFVVHDTPDTGRQAEVYGRKVDKLDARRAAFSKTSAPPTVDTAQERVRAENEAFLRSMIEADRHEAARTKAYKVAPSSAPDVPLAALEDNLAKMK